MEKDDKKIPTLGAGRVLSPHFQIRSDATHCQADKTKDRGQSVLCRCISQLEPSHYRTEHHAIGYCIQVTSENLFPLSYDVVVHGRSELTN